MIRLQGVALEAPGAGRGRRLLLENLDLSIHSGEYVAVTGANGAGKSLLLGVLAGLRRPTGGILTFDPADISVALVFQNPDDQIVGSTVERDLAFGLENQGCPPAEIRARVDEALAWSGLQPVAAQPPHLLSDGEKQRLALTSALVLRPSVLLLDEPTARLDPPGRRRFLDAVRSVRSAGATIVHVTHRSEELLNADRVVGLRRGRMIFEGTPEELSRSEHADDLGILWSGLHRLRRGLRRRGIAAAGDAGPGWNDVAALVSEVRA